MKRILLLFMVAFSVIPVFSQVWEVHTFKDEFGDEDPSGDKYIASIQEGTFSNSATSNSKLACLMFIQKPNTEREKKIGILGTMKLFEYGRSLVTTYSTTKYKITIKEEDGTIKKLEDVVMFKGGNEIFFKDDLIDAMKRNKVLKVNLKEITDGYPSTYKINIDCTGFVEALNEI